MHLQRWLSEKLLSPKCCSFGVLIAVIFFRVTVVFGNSYFEEDLFEASKYICKDNIFFKTPLAVVYSFNYCVILFKERSSDRAFTFLTLLAFLGGSAGAIHSIIKGDFFNGVVVAIHLFRDYMEHIIFGSCYSLIPAIFLEELKGSLFI